MLVKDILVAYHIHFHWLQTSHDNDFSDENWELYSYLYSLGALANIAMKQLENNFFQSVSVVTVRMCNQFNYFLPLSMAYLEVNPKIQLFIKTFISVGPLQGLKTFYN